MNVAAFSTGKANGKKSINADDPMPFGKHKGLSIETVPRDYLVWCLQKADVCNPDAERYWPEFRALVESMVGAHAPVKPAPMPLALLCESLRRDGITLSVDRGKVASSEPLDEARAEAVEAHRGTLSAVLGCSGATSAPKGSARLIVGVEVRAIVKAWYSRMSRRFHPDLGGSPEAQIAVNQGYKDFLELVTEWEKTR